MEHMQPEEKEKLRLLYETYKNRMYITSYRVLSDPYKAEDAVHEAFVALSKNVSKLGDVDSIATASYVIKAVKNTALNMIRKNQRESVVAIEEIDEVFDESMLDMICSEENFSIIVSSIMSLDEKYRDVLSFYYLNELTVKEISQLLGRKETTVKQQLSML